MLVKFKDMERSMVSGTYAMLVAVTQKVEKDATYYVEFELCDGESNITARQINTTIADLGDLAINTPTVVWVALSVDTYNGVRGYTVRNIVRQEGPGYDLDYFKIKGPADDDAIYDQMIANIKASHVSCLDDAHYNSLACLTVELLNENKDAFRNASEGELLRHTASMVEKALKVAGSYPELDRELLVCGTALRDIGIVRTLQSSADERLLGHVAIGIMMLGEFVSRTDAYDPGRVRLLQHMIASQHAQSERGAITDPAIPEAEVLQMLDRMDTIINVYETAYKDMREGGLSLAVADLQGATVYKPVGLIREVNTQERAYRA